MQFAEPWAWVNPEYELTIPYGISDIDFLIIDPDNHTTDIDRENNLLNINIEEGTIFILER
jgi:hypothetical protein